MPLLHTNDIETFYEDSGGDGAPVVLIHGHSVDHRMWPAQTLALRAAGLRVIRYDVRGHGRSSAPDDGYTWTAYADDLRALLDGLDIGVANLVGFSLGGGIALQFALDHPGRVRALALIDAAVPGFAYSENFAAGIEALVDGVRAHGWPAVAERLWLSTPLFAGLRRHPAAYAVVRELVLQYRARDYLADSPEPDAVEAVDRLRELRPPTLVLVGEDDLEDFRLAAQLVAANAPRAKRVMVADGGHLLPLERPDDVNRRLLEFFAHPEAAIRPDIHLRPATIADAEALGRIDGRYATDRVLVLERRGLAPELAFDLTITLRDEPSVRDDARPPAFWRDHIEGGGAALVATLEGTPIGAAALSRWPETGALWVSDLRVDPAVRRCGVGRALLEAAEAEGRARGLLRLRLEAPQDNVDAIAFFLRCGYRISGLDDRLSADRGDGERVLLFLSRELDPAETVDREARA